MNIIVGQKVKDKKKYYLIHFPDYFSEIDFEKLSLETPPYIPLKERIRKVFNDLYITTQKTKTLDLPVFNGKKAEVQMEVWENGKHIIFAKGEKYFCPCNLDLDCIMK